VTPVLVDTGFLIALYRPSDRKHAASWSYLRERRHPLATVAAVIVETCFFLAPSAKLSLLSWVRQGAMPVFEVPVGVYAQIEATLRRYGDHDIDFADAALVWLANEAGARSILTVDRTDFELFRLKGNRRFDLLDW
jgi:predicted nucleic acid-binding protein